MAIALDELRGDGGGNGDGEVERLNNLVSVQRTLIQLLLHRNGGQARFDREAFADIVNEWPTVEMLVNPDHLVLTLRRAGYYEEQAQRGAA